ncbi:MAG: hypothetical protein K2N35_12500 [Muribaculaceae bacterium]|nr:hypothetical protein [Muribaculaceae bacterium]
MPTKSEKIAIARIFADLIKADRIVDTGEMEYWRNICLKYDIDRETRMAAKEISFADAVKTICGAADLGLGEDLLGDCRAMTVSDGFCAHPEALLMIALNTMFSSKSSFTGDIYSLPRASFDIDIATAIYVENEYDPEVNNAIRKSYRSIFKELQLAGLHFVYIPKIIEHYSSTDSVLFRDILTFLAPSLSDAGIDKAYNALMGMTSGTYCKDLLCNKCGFIELRNTAPSILIKIGNSFVGETRYANYLKIEVDEDILTIIQKFVDEFTDMQSSDVFVVNTSEERDNQFHFHGFYKQLLDIFLVRRNIRSSIVIDPYREEIFFPDIDEKAMGMHRREKALYALMLCLGSSGINFNRPRTASELKDFQRRMKKLQRRYAAIYELFGGEKDTAPDLTQPEIRRPIMACLRRSIARLDALYNPADYTVTKDPDGAFAVHVEPDIIYVAPLKGDTPIPLQNSPLYRLFSSL